MRARHVFSPLLAVALIAFTPRYAFAQQDGFFEPGRVQLQLAVGAASSFDHTYFLLGFGVGVFVLHGLQVGAQVDSWLGNSPNVTRVAPEVRYVLDAVDVVKPYIGGFYRRWFIGDGFVDYDSVGGRAGLIFVQGQHAYISAGAAFERVVTHCDVNCSYWYPEIGISLIF